ncbi:MAG: hypothetical protein IPI33_05785 [Dehalococcoidia bacterium]|nr:hypothetical protein [Dehalococcoidia bacterium]
MAENPNSRWWTLAQVVGLASHRRELVGFAELSPVFLFEGLHRVVVVVLAGAVLPCPFEFCYTANTTLRLRPDQPAGLDVGTALIGIRCREGALVLEVLFFDLRCPLLGPFPSYRGARAAPDEVRDLVRDDLRFPEPAVDAIGDELERFFGCASLRFEVHAEFATDFGHVADLRTPDHGKLETHLHGLLLHAFDGSLYAEAQVTCSARVDRHLDGDFDLPGVARGRSRSAEDRPQFRKDGGEVPFHLGLQLVLGAFDGLLVLPHVLARLVADLGELFQFGLCVDLEPGEAWDSLLAAGCVPFVRVLPDRDVLDNLVEDIQRPVLGAAGLKVHPVLADAVVLLEQIVERLHGLAAARKESGVGLLLELVPRPEPLQCHGLARVHGGRGRTNRGEHRAIARQPLQIDETLLSGDDA